MTQQPAHIACIILTTKKGEYILQQRDQGLNGAAHLRGKIGFFGGFCEPNETPLAAILRETKEELDLTLRPDAVHHQGAYQKKIEVHGDNNFVDVFVYNRPVDPEHLTIHEGLGYVLVDATNVEKYQFTAFAGQLIHSLLKMDTEIAQYTLSK